MTDISIWLLPEKSQLNDIQNEVDRLALKYNACSFLPHMTAYYLGNSLPLQEVVGIVQDVSKTTKCLSLNLEDISFADSFTKTFFARYSMSRDFQSLFNYLKEKFYASFAYELSPHITLLYKNGMTTHDKKIEIGNIHNIPKIINLNRLAIITKEGKTIAQEKDVLDWQVSYDYPLQ